MIPTAEPLLKAFSALWRGLLKVCVMGYPFLGSATPAAKKKPGISPALMVHALNSASTSVVKGEQDTDDQAACRLQADILPDLLSRSSS